MSKSGSRVAIYLLLLVVPLLLALACAPQQPQIGTRESESMARYRERYRKSGGFDPVSKSVGQNMR
jgi:hypothetical protein